MSELEEYVKVLEEIERRKAGRKLFTYFPDTGPLRRELYQKHLQFFRLGATIGTRGFIAGNRVGKTEGAGGYETVLHLTGRYPAWWEGAIFEGPIRAWVAGDTSKCITIDSKIDTIDGKKSVRDLLNIGDGFAVWAWDGEKKVVAHASPPFKKAGLHACYRITLADGQWVEVADHHRILCSDGLWRRLSELLPIFEACHLLTSSEPGQSVRGAGDAHSFESSVDCLGGCSLGSHQYDGQPRHAAINGQVSPPLSSDVQPLCCGDYGVGGLAHKRTNSDRILSGHPSIAGYLIQDESISDQFSVISNRIFCTISGLCLLLRQGCRRLVDGLEDQPQSTCEDAPREDGVSLSCKRPLVVGSNEIIRCSYIGMQEVYDFTVDVYHNYIAADLVHHNTVREITQEKLLGPWGKFGTGLIPADDIIKHTSKAGVAEAVDTIWVKHYDLNGQYDGDSKVTFKSYDQGREAFQGTEQDLIWLDEESDDKIRGESMMRLMTTNGLLIETFTPLKGITEVVLQYIPKGEAPADGSAVIGEDKALVMAGWDDVPHLGEAEKRRMLAEIPPHLRDARSKGIPSLGSGAIYPVPETEIKVKDFQIPNHWPRLYGMDVGWNCTAAIFAAWDRDTDTMYLYAEHYRGKAEPSIHATAIRAKGEWIPGEIDPAARGRAQKDGEQLLQNYKDLGLKLGIANNGVESGIFEVWQRLSTGRLKVFASLTNWFSEYRLYRRDEKGNIVKANDHAQDCTRYLVNADARKWKTRPVKTDRSEVMPFIPHDRSMGHLG